MKIFLTAENFMATHRNEIFYYLYLFCFPVDLQKSLRLKAGNFCLILSHQPGSYLAANGAGT